MSNLTPQQTEAATLPLTQALGRFVADIAFARLPEAAVKTARLGFTDCIGTMIAGSPRSRLRRRRPARAPERRARPRHPRGSGGTAGVWPRHDRRLRRRLRSMG